MSVLDTIADAVRADLERRRRPLAELRRRPPSPFEAAFAGPGPMRAIAEIKFRSPSEGALRPREDPADIAAGYLRAGATAISVLTERAHFGGSHEDLRRVREAHPEALLLMKDFVLDEYQLHEALDAGADGVLLIVALLGRERAAALYAQAKGLGLGVLVEVHDEAELEAALSFGATLVGINNRDLKTLRVSLETSHRLAPLARGATLVAESGIKTGVEARALAQAGFAAMLVGSSLMKRPDPGAALEALLAEARS
jgi:indole-3-glycerol phosphate synthase